jgi:glycosyltransferase involved in cell wall biosynthesis
MNKAKSIWLIRSQPKESDGRLNRYINVLKSRRQSFRIISWYRKGQPKTDIDIVIPYVKAARTGARFKNALNLLGWNCFILASIFKSRKDISVIHAADFDTILPSLLMGKCFRIPVIYDIYDKYSASRDIKGVLGRVFDWLEDVAIKASSHTIIPHKSRFKQFGLKSDVPSVTVLENVPIYASEPREVLSLKRDKNVKFILCYVGILEATHRGLEDLLKVVKSRPEIQLYVAGFGALKNEVSRYAKECDNIDFLGEVNREEAFQILAFSDVHVGMYYKTVPNHHYAAPNKYYEHLYFGKPLVTTEGTPPGLQVKALSTGWALAEGADEIAECLDSLDLASVDQYASNAKSAWEATYSDYKNYFEGKYISIINDCNQ